MLIPCIKRYSFVQYLSKQIYGELSIKIMGENGEVYKGKGIDNCTCSLNWYVKKIYKMCKSYHFGKTINSNSFPV